MKTVTDTASETLIRDLAPGEHFTLDESRVNSHVRLDDDSPFLDGMPNHVYSLDRRSGRIVEHAPDATGMVVSVARG